MVSVFVSDLLENDVNKDRTSDSTEHVQLTYTHEGLIRISYAGEVY